MSKQANMLAPATNEVPDGPSIEPGTERAAIQGPVAAGPAPSIGTAVHSFTDIAALLLQAAKDECNAIRTGLSDLRMEVARIVHVDAVLSETHAQNQALTRRLHESEHLTLVALPLISVADRCAEQLEAATTQLQGQHAQGLAAAQRAAIQVYEARKADLVEIENILANLGVEPFTVPDDQFHPARQRCLERVPRPSGAVVGKVARRLLKGYQRNGQVVRPECVAVYGPCTETVETEGMNP